MAVDGQCVKFGTINEDEIFFAVVSRDYEEDGFLKNNKCLTKVILNNDNKVLVVDAECLKFEERTLKQCRKEDCLFNLCCYSNSDTGISSGFPVILTVSYNGANRIICSRVNANGKGVYAKQQDLPLPTYIKDSSHEAVFFLQIVKGRSHCYRVESSLWPKWFLSFQAEREGVVKLVLREAGDDVVEGLQLLQP